MVYRESQILFVLFGRSSRHLDREERQDNSTGDRNRTASDMQQPHQQSASGKKDQSRDDRRQNHLATYPGLRLGVELLGHFQKWHQCDLRSHADQQEQEKLCHETGIDDCEIHLKVPPR